MTTKMNYKNVSWQSVGWATTRIANLLAWTAQKERPGVYGHPRGGLILAVGLSHATGLRLLRDPEPNCVWVDNLVDTGETMRQAMADYPGLEPVAMVVTAPHTHIIHAFQKPEHTWLIFPWENKANARADFAAYAARQREFSNQLR